MKSALVVFAAALVALAALACGGGPVATSPRATTPASVGVPATPAPVASAPQASPGGALPSGDELCALLGSADWSALNLAAAQPSVESDGPGTAYCTYSDDSGGSGGLELDAFVDTSVSDAESTFETITGGMPGGTPIPLTGADEVLINPDVDGTFGAIVVRSGRFTYTISLPAGDQSQAQLLALAASVLSRGQSYR